VNARTAGTALLPGPEADRDRPVAVIDVDGVLVLERPVVPVGRHVVSAYGRWSREVLVPTAAPARLRELTEHFELVWAGAWSHMAHSALRDVLQLPPDPFPFLPVQFHKLPAIRRHAAGRRWLLIDDGIHDLGQVPDPDDGLLVPVDSTRGIVDVRPADLLRQLATLPAAQRSDRSGMGRAGDVPGKPSIQGR
jgi:hypothetical protein